MPKRRPETIVERRLSAKPRWVKPRRQRTTPGRRCIRPWTRKRRDTPVSCLRDESSLPPLPHPQFVFERERPECLRFVPAVAVPLYYFDDTMLKRSS